MRVSIILVGVLTLSACGGSATAPGAPTPTPTGTLVSVAGTWAGTTADTTGQAKMSWTLTQNGNAITGTMNISDTLRNMMGNGSMQGTISGSTVTFQMAVPNGAFSGMMSPCSLGMGGQATISNDGRTMTGTYSGNMSGMMSSMQACGGAMNDGHFTLTR